MTETESKLEELSRLLKQNLAIYKEDRDIALKNHRALRAQLDHILDSDFEASEDGVIERAVNESLKLVFESGKRLDSVIQAVIKIVTTQLNNEAREKIADILAGEKGKYIEGPVNIAQLLEDQTKEEEEKKK